MSQSRYYTVSELIKDLIDLKAPAARVNLQIQVAEHTVDGPGEGIEKIYIENEGPAIVIKSNHGNLL